MRSSILAWWPTWERSAEGSESSKRAWLRGEVSWMKVRFWADSRWGPLLASAGVSADTCWLSLVRLGVYKSRKLSV